MKSPDKNIILKINSVFLPGTIYFSFFKLPRIFLCDREKIIRKCSVKEHRKLDTAHFRNKWFEGKAPMFAEDEWNALRNCVSFLVR